MEQIQATSQDVVRHRIRKRQSVIDRLIESQNSDLASIIGGNHYQLKYYLQKQHIMGIVFSTLKVNQSDVFKRHSNGKVNRHRNNVMARFAYFYFCRKYTNESYKDIGTIDIPNVTRYVCDHSSVMHGVATWEDLMFSDKTVNDVSSVIDRQIKMLTY